MPFKISFLRTDHGESEQLEKMGGSEASFFYSQDKPIGKVRHYQKVKIDIFSEEMKQIGNITIL